MLEICNVSKKFSNKHTRTVHDNRDVLENVSFNVDDGDFVSIVGPSGCGKTTLINLIMGLDKPTSGEIFINNKKVSGVGGDRALVFQENALFPWLTVQQNIEVGLRVRGFRRAERNRIAERYLDIINLTDFRDYSIHQLSGGMKQRVAIARALAMESDILLMDEPFGALDANTKNTLHGEILRIWQKTGRTIIFITHDVEEAVLLAKKVIVLGYAPDNVKEIIDIPLEYPRNGNPDVPEYVQRIKDVIARSAQQ